MSVLLQQIAVAAVVLACALYSAWRLASVRLRLRGLAALAVLPGVRRTAWLERLRARTLAQQLSACGACAQAPLRPVKRDAASPNQTPGALRR